MHKSHTAKSITTNITKENLSQDPVSQDPDTLFYPKGVSLPPRTYPSSIPQSRDTNKAIGGSFPWPSQQGESQISDVSKNNQLHQSQPLTLSSHTAASIAVSSPMKRKQHIGRIPPPALIKSRRSMLPKTEYPSFLPALPLHPPQKTQKNTEIHRPTQHASAPISQNESSTETTNRPTTPSITEVHTINDTHTGYQKQQHHFIKGGQEAWQRIRSRLRAELGTTFDYALASLHLRHVTDAGEVVLTIFDQTTLPWIQNQFGTLLLRFWQSELPGITTITLLPSQLEPVSTSTSKTTPSSLTPDTISSTIATPTATIDHHHQHSNKTSRHERSYPAQSSYQAQSLQQVQPSHQAQPRGSARTKQELWKNHHASSKNDSIPELLTPLDPRNTFEKFVSGEANALAFNTARQIPTMLGQTQNQEQHVRLVMFCGAVGLGKTHLLQSIARQAQADYPQKRIYYLSAEHFTAGFLQGIRDRDLRDFKTFFRNADLLLIDDFHFMQNKWRTQEELLFTIDHIFGRNKLLAFAADRPPSQLEKIDERLRSRLCGGLVATLDPCNHELRMAIIERKSQQLNLVLPESTVTLLAERFNNNVRELEGAINGLSTFQNISDQPVVWSTQKVLSVLDGIMKAQVKTHSTNDILHIVAQESGLTRAEIIGKGRLKSHVNARYCAIYTLRQQTALSLSDIGKIFSNRDHSSIRYALQRAEQEPESSPITSLIRSVKRHIDHS